MVRNLFQTSFIVIPILFSTLFSQPEKTLMFDETYTTGLPVFQYNLVRTFNKKEGYFDLNIQAEITNERLHFLKNGKEFISTYVISVAVFKKGKTDEIPLSQKSEKIIYSTKDYSETQLNKSNKKIREHLELLVIYSMPISDNCQHERCRTIKKINGVRKKVRCRMCGKEIRI